MSKKITREFTIYTFSEMLELEKAGKMSSKVVDKARDWLKDVATDNDWYDYVFEMWGNALDQIGFTDAKISYSGFWSQGDGASFKSDVYLPRLVDFLASDIPGKESIDPAEPKVHGHDEDFRGWLVNKVGGKVTRPDYRRLLWAENYLRCSVERDSSNYSHEHTCSFKCEFDDDGRFVPDYNHGKSWEKNMEENYRPDHPLLDKLVRSFREDCEQLRLDLSRAIYASLEEEYDSIQEDENLADLAEGNEWTFNEHGERDEE